MPGIRPPMTCEQVIVRMDERVYKDPNSGCWIYLGPINDRGYPVCTYNGFKISQAYRLTYTIYRAPVDKGLEIDHLCRVRCCVNPWHLEPVTHAENMRRSIGYNIGKHVIDVCRRGHPFTPSNTVHRSDKKLGITWKTCRICTNENQRKNAIKRKLRNQ